MITPFGKNIHFTPNKQKSVLISGQLTDTGVVVAVGEDVQRVKVGDNIAFNGYGARQVEIDGEDCHFVKEDDDVILSIF